MNADEDGYRQTCIAADCGAGAPPPISLATQGVMLRRLSAEASRVHFWPVLHRSTTSPASSSARKGEMAYSSGRDYGTVWAEVSPRAVHAEKKAQGPSPSLRMTCLEISSLFFPCKSALIRGEEVAVAPRRGSCAKREQGHRDRLNRGMAMAIITTPKTVRMTRSCQMATKPASFSSSALKPCTA